jgi:hypothetical protein
MSLWGYRLVGRQQEAEDTQEPDLEAQADLEEMEEQQQRANQMLFGERTRSRAPGSQQGLQGGRACMHAAVHAP